jgi:hypothetical protein
MILNKLDMTVLLVLVDTLICLLHYLFEIYKLCILYFSVLINNAKSLEGSKST